MAPWVCRQGAADQSRLPSFSKRRWKNKSPEPPVASPTTVLSPRHSTGTSSEGEGEPQLLRIVNHLASHDLVQRISFDVEMACFEPINSKTWTVTTDKPSDLLVEVNEISFHLHKLPILSRSALLHRLAAKFPESEMACINLGSVPGGADSFALAAKFCYGIDVELTPSIVAGLHCVSEYLEMTEHLEEGNVSSKAEAYLNSVVLNSWHYSMLVLTSCEHLLPWAEDLQIIQRCSQSIARQACIPQGSSAAWWYEEVSCLTLHCFEKVMDAMARNVMDPNLMGGALEHYGHKWLPGVFKQSEENTPKTSSPNTPAGSRLESPTGDRSPVHEHSQESRLHEVIVEQNKNRYMIERIATMLPQQRDAVGCRFLLRLLRAANMFNCSVECRAELEKRAGLQLDQASLSDLLIPSFCHTSEYLYDVDLVSRLLDHFLSQEQVLGSGQKNSKFFNKKIFGALVAGTAAKQSQAQVSARCKTVAKLLDTYLAEVARDSKLPLAKFQSLAEAVPGASRVSDDGLYRAIDTYLKIHPGLTELEKKKLCRILDSHRFSVAACMHAAQNERLPLRIVVQVLFGEQLKLREVITGISQSIDEDRAAEGGLTPLQTTGEAQAMMQTTNQMEIRALQTELTTMRMKYMELEENHASMMEMMDKLVRNKTRRNSGSSWTTFTWKKASNKRDQTSSFRPTNNTTAAQRWRHSMS